MISLHLLLGHLIRLMPSIRGRHRLQHWWLYRGYRGTPCLGATPSGAHILCDLSLPFESMVWLGREEWDDISCLSSLLECGQTFVDVGANIGTWTLEAACRVGPTGNVHAFEPNPRTVAKLRANVELNKRESCVSVNPSAVSSLSGLIVMDCEKEHNCSHITDSTNAQAIELPAITLDDYFGSATRVHGIKIDVEGHEHAVLMGGTELIQRCRPWIVVEFNLDLTTAKKLGEWDVHQFLVSKGYLPGPLPSTGTLTVDENYKPTIYRYANLVYRPH
jgi:FkbM family methyltransferase